MNQEISVELQQATFGVIASLIEERRDRVLRTVNAELVDLYWEIGKVISGKIESESWGKKVVDDLANYLKHSQPGLRGFSRSNLLRMRQFYDLYRDHEIVAPLVRQLPWSHHLLIMAQAKRPEEREFYLNQTIGESWTKRELARQLKMARFEQSILNPPKVAPLVRQMHSAATQVFRDSYNLEFLNLPDKALLQRKLHEFLEAAGHDTESAE